MLPTNIFELCTVLMSLLSDSFRCGGWLWKELPHISYDRRESGLIIFLQSSRFHSFTESFVPVVSYFRSFTRLLFLCFINTRRKPERCPHLESSEGSSNSFSCGSFLSSMSSINVNKDCPFLQEGFFVLRFSGNTLRYQARWDWSQEPKLRHISMYFAHIST